MPDILPAGSETAWHAEPIETAFDRLETQRTGLSRSEAAARLERYGPNSLPAPRTRNLFIRFVAQIHNVLIYVLLASAAVTLAFGHLTDCFVILAVVIANAVIGVIQEGKAENAMASIRKIIAPQAVVLRDGQRQTVDGKTVVPGDIVLLQAGEKVPADARIIEASTLSVQEAILTGESLAVEKQTDPAPVDRLLAERSSMAYSGTMITRGQGIGLVVATGANSEIGKIGGLVGKVEQLQTPLIAQMNVFARWLTFLILIFGALLFAYGLWIQHHEPQMLFMAIVGLSVAAIPEGLPAVLTITLAIGVQAMAKRNAIVRRLPAIETLGSVSVICTDKTGTLTFNEMSASTIALEAGDFAVSGEGYAPRGDISCVSSTPTDTDANPERALARLGQIARLCNDAQLQLKDDVWTVAGDPMEGALLTLAGKIDERTAAETVAWTRESVLPFDARHRYMATLNVSSEPDGNALITVKGAPERLLAMCEKVLASDGSLKPLDLLSWHERADEMAARGQRVLALAERQLPKAPCNLRPEDVESGLVLVGLVGLMDPPRPEAITSVASCQSAGIRVKMITGDHAGTASAIGKMIGLLQPRDVLTGSDIDQMNDAQLRDAALETDIFARTSPEHKLRLVEALQAEGLTVAMTGDGVNDAPALKRADAGIAMGLKGSEAARESADLVLADDNFRSIADAVREGRTVYDNLVKVIAWTLPTSTAEALTIVAALLLGLTLPITPIQILWINLITASTLGIALAFEPAEAGTMSRPPRRRKQPLLTGRLAWYIVLVSGLFMAAVFVLFVLSIERGQSVAYARTMAVNAFAVLEIFQLLFVRTMHTDRLDWRTLKGTWPVWTAVSVVITGQIAITYIPVLQTVFGTEALSLSDIGLIFGFGVILFIVLEVEKRMRAVVSPDA
ncbi:HAD-IC family P-type ATPase [Roseibium sp.]|uniref:HAD-IC family P-type ATPase n=1 Tax=Roseibium sp. TaxID=1936156 RepID=UPI003A97DC8E